MKLKKLLSLVLAGMISVLSFSGCGSAGKTDDQNVITINYGIKNAEQIIQGLSEQFPDIDFEITPAYCVNQSEYLRKALLTGNSGDIFFYTQKPDGNEAAQYLLDLSSYDFIGNFDRSVINSYLVDGHIYCIPGPVTLRGVAYNKTLFEEHGWSKPESHRELVELCKRIRSETDDVIPIAMSLGGLAYPFSLVTTLSQAGFLGTPAGEEWEKRFLAGEASVSEGWGEGLEMTAELIDAGAFEAEKYIGVWDGTAANMDFAQGKAAMFIMWAGQASLLKMIEENTDYEYAFMPFYGKEEGQLTIGASTSFTWGISKRLGEKGNEKKLENALRVMEWLSTPKAQDLMKTYMTDSEGNTVHTSAEISPLAGSVNDSDSSPYFKELWKEAEKGNKMPSVYSGYESVIINGGQTVQDAMLAGSSEGMIEKFIALADSDYKDHLSGGEGAVLCKVMQDFTEEQTVRLIAEGINEAGLGDLALVTHTGRTKSGISNRFGAAGRYFAGNITSQDYNIILGDQKNLQLLTLTGAQIKKLLSEGKRIYNGNGYADFPYYWAGIEAEFSKDGRVISVKHNGAELGDETLYKVVFCNNDYTEETAAFGDPSDTGVNISEYWLEYISEKKEIYPPEVSKRQKNSNTKKPVIS